MFWEKALENIDSAASELTSRRYNASANRAYYAAFHAAILALLRAGIEPPGAQWRHGFVRAQFAGQLVTRRKAYPGRVPGGGGGGGRPGVGRSGLSRPRRVG